MEKASHSLPAQPHAAKAHKARPSHKAKGMSLTDKIFLLILVFSVVYIGYLYFQDKAIEILRMNPYVWSFFTHITREISKRTLMGLFYASFFGSLFFIFLPIELLFLYYLALGYSVPLVIALVMIGYLMGLSIDYLFGFVVGAKMLKFFLRTKFDKFHNMTSKWGAAVVLIGNIIPFPIQPASVVIGSAKYSFKKFFLLSLLGVFVKLFALVVISTHLVGYF